MITTIMIIIIIMMTIIIITNINNNIVNHNSSNATMSNTRLMCFTCFLESAKSYKERRREGGGTRGVAGSGDEFG